MNSPFKFLDAYEKEDKDIFFGREKETLLLHELVLQSNLEEENKTIGIVLCQSKNDTLVEITLPENNDQIFASRYQTVLPSKEDLQKLLNPAHLAYL